MTDCRVTKDLNQKEHEDLVCERKYDDIKASLHSYVGMFGWSYSKSLRKYVVDNIRKYVINPKLYPDDALMVIGRALCQFYSWADENPIEAIHCTPGEWILENYEPSDTDEQFWLNYYHSKNSYS